MIVIYEIGGTLGSEERDHEYQNALCRLRPSFAKALSNGTAPRPKNKFHRFKHFEKGTF